MPDRPEPGTGTPEPPPDDVVERVARKLHETSEMRMYTWARAGASRRHGHWHDVMRDRAREVLAVAAQGAGTTEPADDLARVTRERDEVVAAHALCDARLRAFADKLDSDAKAMTIEDEATLEGLAEDLRALLGAAATTPPVTPTPTADLVIVGDSSTPEGQPAEPVRCQWCGNAVHDYDRSHTTCGPALPFRHCPEETSHG